MTAFSSVMPVPHQVRDKLRRASRLYLKKLPVILKKSKSEKSLIVQMAKPLNSDLAQRARVSMPNKKITG
jgi:hypothetical protein